MTTNVIVTSHRFHQKRIHLFILVKYKKIYVLQFSHFVNSWKISDKYKKCRLNTDFENTCLALPCVLCSTSQSIDQQ